MIDKKYLFLEVLYVWVHSEKSEVLKSEFLVSFFLHLFFWKTSPQKKAVDIFAYSF